MKPRKIESRSEFIFPRQTGERAQRVNGPDRLTDKRAQRVNGPNRQTDKRANHFLIFLISRDIGQHPFLQRLRPADQLVDFSQVGRLDFIHPTGPVTILIDDGGVGYSCIAEIRTIETINYGKPSTSFMQFGDRIRIEMNDRNGDSIFGTIYQVVTKYEG